LAEFQSADRVRISSGEAGLIATAEHAIELVEPDGKPLRVADRGVYRVKDEKLSRLAADPAWLRDFESRSRETLGSLIAQVDGRNVGLSVGEHTVRVDIRDQLARTVVEETFVNHTGGVLEGVFTFPLPADASISGFGMWIGSELVEADVVEKERAREIFETLLRERADPALLEWSGRNLFKARVFPILPHAAKRIRLSYTQVLPWRGGGYRYQYPLTSDMLKQHPLERLAIDVRIDSALPLERVACPTHAARLDRGAHAARVEFVAQSYVPTRDFEIEIEPSTRQSEAVLVTHHRGNDGYFMLQLMPPSAGGSWQRRTVDGASRPLELLVLADTSASIDATSRSRQAELIDALLASLAPRDKFNLATCDVDCRWAFDQPQAAAPKQLAAARHFFDQRPARGWTDLDKEPRLVHRLVTALVDLAAKPDAGKLAVRVLAYLDRAIVAAPASTRWKLYKAQLLVALDRPQELERTLAGWIDADVAQSLWRRMLAYLLAEVARLDAAIAQFERLRYR
jgi:hypothetical protein